MVPWVPEDIFVLSILMFRGESASTRREAPREKNNLWWQELRVSFPYNFRIKYLTKPVWSWRACLFSLTLTAEIWSYVTLRLRCMTIARKLTLLRCIKSCHIFFSKKYTSSVKYIKRTEVSWEVWEVRTLYVFGSQQDKRRSATLVLLYQVKLNIARQNGYTK